MGSDSLEGVADDLQFTDKAFAERGVLEQVMRGERAEGQITPEVTGEVEVIQELFV